MTVLPPGTLRQLMYLRERLGHMKPGRFIEIGPGSGGITRLLLDLGWPGQSYDLEAVTIERLQIRFAREVGQGRYLVVNMDYLSRSQQLKSVDLVIFCMFVERQEDALESAFIRKSSEMLERGGLMIGLVSGASAHWDIENEIVEYFRRYTQTCMRELAFRSEWQVGHLSGLNYAVFNTLRPISGYLIGRGEKSNLKV